MRASPVENNITTTVTPTEISPNRLMPLPMILPASCFLPAPILVPTYTVSPIESPVMTTVIVCIIWLPVETADTYTSEKVPPNCPTTNRSMAPYVACKNNASSTGSANRISGENILPSVKLFVFSVFIINQFHNLPFS